MWDPLTENQLRLSEQVCICNAQQPNTPSSTSNAYSNRTKLNVKPRLASSRSSFFDQSILGKSQFVRCGPKTDDKLDRLAHKLVSARFPTNGRQLRQFCNAGIKSAGFILGYAKHCLTEFVQKTIQVIFFPVTNEIGIICRTGRMSKKAKELLKAARCGNAARPGLQMCYDRFVENQLAIANTTNTKLIIPMLCCQFNKLRECFKHEAEESKACTRRTIDFVERYALELFGEILNIMCYEYQDSNDRCDKVNREIPVLDFTQVKKPKSFIRPMLDIMKLIGDGF